MAMWMFGLDFLFRNMPHTPVVWKYCFFWSFRFSALFFIFNRNYHVGAVALVTNLLDILLSYFYLFSYVNVELSWRSIFQGHNQVIMDFYSWDFHLPNLILVIFVKFLYHHRKCLWNFVGYLHAVHLPNYSHLMPVDYFNYIDFIRIDGKPCSIRYLDIFV